jgi:adenine-specific DNA-methyltransferase
VDVATAVYAQSVSIVGSISAPPRQETRGEVFTRRWVVDLILDLAGYTSDRDLAALRAVEPACGEGAFLGPMVERLSRSCRAFGRPISDSAHSLLAHDLFGDNVERTRTLVRLTLAKEGWDAADGGGLADQWVTHEDYLLNRPGYLGLFGRSDDGEADFVIGNPPYIRPEDVSYELYQKYRIACPTMLGRADVYVGFYEAALRSLRPEGVCAFICADRWMHNQYGRGLRSLISEDFSVDTMITMHDVDAFEKPVSAYPAVSVIRRAKQGQVKVLDADAGFGPNDIKHVSEWARGRHSETEEHHVRGTRLAHWFEGSDSWPGGNPKIIEMVESLNDQFAPVEDQLTGTKVGIGVATGNDGLFVTTDADLVESERLLPLTMSADGTSGKLCWSGHYLVNPWEDDGSLVELERYPKLRQYLEFHGKALKRRHVAKRSQVNWYRTIDKVNSVLTETPKLLFPDMKLNIHPVLDSGHFYPHHNLYWITSDKWDLDVLGGLLMSKVAEAFVSAYCVKMRGGTLRFQAQYLRRIRVPGPDDISGDDRSELAAAFTRRDAVSATDIALRIYGVEEYRDILLAK